MIPDYIRSSPVNSFGRYTICNRFPKIIDDIINYNQGHASQLLRALVDGIPDLKIGKLNPQNAIVALFNESITPFLNQGIFDAPFFTAELFFYQLMAEQLGYHTNGLDYFSTLKQQSLTDAMQLVTDKPDLFPADWGTITPENQIQALHFALWGNLADLSLFTLSEQRTETSFTQDRMLIDHSQAFIRFFQSYSGTVHFFLDNAGYELVSDIYLMAVLLRINPNCKIRAHVKPIPMFVSDTTPSDWRLTMDAIGDRKEATVRNWHATVASALEEQRISITTHPFWSSAYYFSDYWLNTLGVGTGELIICKGDLNYRRFFEDRSWPGDTPTETAVTTATAPVLFLRTLKSEIMTGLNPATVNNLRAADPDWSTSGRYGIVQLLAP